MRGEGRSGGVQVWGQYGASEELRGAPSTWGGCERGRTGEEARLERKGE